MTPGVDANAVAAAAHELARRDPDLARVLEAHGPPPVWHRGPGFASLVHIILGQQVSLASAQAALDRLRAAAGGGVTPEAVATLGEGGLRRAGFTRQKASYIVELAEAMVDGRMDLRAIELLPDDAAIAALVAHRGVGRWTADIYLLIGLGRPDVWPSTDLALLVATRQVKGLAATTSSTEIAAIADTWRPWRSTAARMLWQTYLIARGRPLD